MEESNPYDTMRTTVFKTACRPSGGTFHVLRGGCWT